MANGSLPAYLASTKPNPVGNRAPWYKNTAQTFAGIFLWIAFYDQMAGTSGGAGALGMGSLGTCLAALLAAGVLTHVLFYLVPGMLGMKTGLPLYIVGTSTFGTKGGYFLPGIFMGLLQIGWYSVATFYATKLVMGGLGLNPELDNTLFGPPPAGGTNAFSITFAVLAVVWGYLFAFAGLGFAVLPRAHRRTMVVAGLILLLTAVASSLVAVDFGRMFEVLAPVFAVAVGRALQVLRTTSRSGDLVIGALLALVAVQCLTFVPNELLAGQPPRAFRWGVEAAGLALAAITYLGVRRGAVLPVWRGVGRPLWS